MPMPKRKSSASSANVDQWPVIWRVVAPNCGSYGHDMLFIETADEGSAREKYRSLRCAQWPVRLERVQCGPLPANAKSDLAKLYGANAQNPGDVMRAIPGRWTRGKAVAYG
jgi:hypothetical protein